MKTPFAPAMGLAVLAGLVPPAPAQNLDEVFRKTSPTVVVVRAKGRDVTAAGMTRFIETGSGVLISSDGRVMTAAHVVNGKDEITVEGIGGEVVRARIISANAAADVSLLQLERVTRAMRVARIGNSDSVRVGEQVMVVGAPYGLAYSMSVGWISARWPPNTIFPDMPLAEFFQTTATINTGNSGGPLFNMQGEVVGIVSQNIARVFNVPAPAGFLVKTVAQGSMASKMGLQGADGVVSVGGKEIPVGGDIILSVEGIPVGSEDNIEQIRNRLAGIAPGGAFKMSVLRAGKVVELTGTAE